MTTFYIIVGGVLVTLAAMVLAVWLARRAGRDESRAEFAAELARVTKQRDDALTALAKARTIADAAVNGPHNVEDALRRLDGGDA